MLRITSLRGRLLLASLTVGAAVIWAPDVSWAQTSLHPPFGGPHELDSSANDTTAVLRLAPSSEWEKDGALRPGVMYAVGANSLKGDSLIFSIDAFSSSPVARPIATMDRILFDAAIDPTTQTLYLLDSRSELYRADLTSLTVTSLGRGPVGTNSLVFDSSGQAYEWGLNRQLYKVNKLNGQTTLVGETGYAGSGDLVFDLDGALFGTTTSGHLIRINPSTGASTRIGATGFADLYGLAINSSGALFAGRGSDLTGTSSIYRVDKATGRSNLVGSFANGNYPITGLAFLPSTPSSAQLLLSRVDLMTFSGTGTPSGGVFSYVASKLRGANVTDVRLASGFSAQDNPNEAKLINPGNPTPNGAPTPGGLARITVTYTLLGGGKIEKQFLVPTFGLSCYYTASESDWGTAPDSCKSITINGQRYSGVVRNPLGLSGLYCSAFIAQVKLQGSAYTRDGRIVQYIKPRNKIVEVSEIRGADGTQVVAGRTLARDREIIPKGSVAIDIAGVGDGLVANDIGDAIKGYRIDLYKGAGSTACRNFRNDIRVAACNPSNSKCPAKDIQ